MEEVLIVPLSMAQIEAANRLHGKLLQWQVTDRALHILQESLPGFDIEATLLKVAAINQLYGTNVYAVVRMAQHVTEVMLEESGMEDEAKSMLIPADGNVKCAGKRLWGA